MQPVKKQGWEMLLFISAAQTVVMLIHFIGGNDHTLASLLWISAALYLATSVNWSSNYTKACIMREHGCNATSITDDEVLAAQRSFLPFLRAWPYVLLLAIMLIPLFYRTETELGIVQAHMGLLCSLVIRTKMEPNLSNHITLSRWDTLWTVQYVISGVYIALN